MFRTDSLLEFFADDPDRAAYLLQSDVSSVGFALISGLSSERRLMSELFVVRGARRQGIARAAVHELFALHPGEWEIPFQESNLSAARFWRGVAAGIAGDAVQEERRAVPDRPHVPPDVWITISVV